MPKCPECHAEIDYLHEYSEAEARYRFSLEDDEVIYSFAEYIDDDFPIIDYECPKCGQIICSDKDVAIAFLQGEEIIPLEEPVLTEPAGRYFPVIRLCREEVAMMFPKELREEKMAEIDDADIGRIASRVGNILVDDHYWEVLEEVVNGW